MNRTLAKQVSALEAQVWAQAEAITLPLDEEVAAFYEMTEPLDVPIYNAWLNSNAEAAKLDARVLQIGRNLPSPHPAFLPDENARYRHHQWALHNSHEYRELTEAQWGGFMAYARAHYDLTAGRLSLALQVFGEFIEHLMAVQDYVGFPRSREDFADVMTRHWRHVQSLQFEQPEGEQAEIWRRAAIETEQEVYGRTMTEQEMESEWTKWREVEADMEAGKPAGEVAASLRRIQEQYPRRVAVGSFEGQL